MVNTDDETKNLSIRKTTVDGGESSANFNSDESKQSMPEISNNSSWETSVSKTSDIGDFFAMQKARQQAKQIKKRLQERKELDGMQLCTLLLYLLIDLGVHLTLNSAAANQRRE